MRPGSTPSHLGESTRAWIARLFVSVWFVGILIHVVYRVRDLRLCDRQLRESSPNCFPDLTQAFNQALSQHQLRRTPRLLVSPAMSAPAVVGSFHPAVIVPRDLHKNFTVNQMTSMFSHELSHIARKDHWMVGAQILATTILLVESVRVDRVS